MARKGAIVDLDLDVSGNACHCCVSTCIRSKKRECCQEMLCFKWIKKFKKKKTAVEEEMEEKAEKIVEKDA
jgi:hypothetical protein